MKNIIIFSIIALMFIVSACKKDNPAAPERITLNGVTSLKGSKAAYDLARLNWIAKHVTEVYATNFRRGFNYNPIDNEFAQRDTINGKLFFFGLDAIGGIHADENGLGSFLSKARNVVFTVAVDSNGNIHGNWSATQDQFMKDPDAKMIFDTVAYVPNSVMDKTRHDVLEALRAGDNQRCYELFNKAVVFIPITGEEYRELERQGLN